MDFLEIPSGGMRLFGDDINYLQTGAKTAIAATLKKMADSNGGWVILSGFNTAQVTGSTYSISGGWAYIDNEICYFVGDNVTFSGSVDWSTVHFEAYSYDFPVGSRLLATGATYNPQKRREVRIATTSTGKTAANSNRYEYVLKTLLDSLSMVESNTVTLAANVLIHGGLPVILYKKDGRVFFTVNLETDPAKDYNALSEVLCTLPLGFRPDRIINIPVYNSAKTFSFLSIGDNGVVYFYNTDVTNWVASAVVSIHNVSFDVP